ncbi:lytic transglycosylase domain-containing protein [Actinomadura violacea]|uniref:Lytic transglycosylase domain-containing protein n=1 Tax=Actinomadura violacea TaxID=2819934 RepID=A0ABS3S4C3_9ACTN|nr:lytic transglycosylase domain-containing protein [Actinomadura violacea]MBO2463817.1 lytic transglycosylase domain-containing protein [Actinomadura violacea]
MRPAAGAAPAGDTLGFQPVEQGESPAGATGAFAMGAPGPAGQDAGEHRDEIAFGAAAGAGSGHRPGGPRRLGGSRSSRGSARRSGGNGLKIAAVAAGALVVLGGGGAAFAMTGGSGDGGTKTVQPKRVADAAAAPKVDPMVMEQMRRKEAYERASRATRQDPSKGPKLQAKGKPIPTPTPTKKKDSGGGSSGGPSGDPVPAGEAQQIAKKLLPSYGMSGSGQFGCLVNLWNRESHWNTHAANPSGAYGIPQALPGSKMASAGSDWQNSATTQIKWGLGYIKDRYSTPCGAWAHSQSSGWY